MVIDIVEIYLLSCSHTNVIRRKTLVHIFQGFQITPHIYDYIHIYIYVIFTFAYVPLGTGYLRNILKRINMYENYNNKIQAFQIRSTCFHLLSFWLADSLLRDMVTCIYICSTLCSELKVYSFRNFIPIRVFFISRIFTWNIPAEG